MSSYCVDPDQLSSTIDNHKVCFICCINDHKQFSRCVSYLNAIDLPSDFSVELLPVENAPSMAAGYNFAMRQSNAKYKVYLHQDVYVTYPQILSNIISFFGDHPQVGLLGVVGAQSLPRNGIWWESPDCVGKVRESHSGPVQLLEFPPTEGTYSQVAALDGLILMTQYDIPWRDDLFTGWHFYDVSQCLEFIRAGYEVGVPKQEEAWCIHDCGIVSTEGYDKYRKIFLDEYFSDWANDQSRATAAPIDDYCLKDSSYYQTANPYLLQQINLSATDVLDIGCGEGELGVAIKQKAHCRVFGVEYLPRAAEQAKLRLDGILCGDITTLDLPFPNGTFDHVIFGDVLEHLVDPWSVLTKIRPYLKQTGTVIASIPNMGHISIISGLISGKFTYENQGLLDKTHLRFFTADEIGDLFDSTGYSIQSIRGITVQNDWQAKLIDSLDRIRSVFGIHNDRFSDQARTYQYIVEAILK